MDTLDFPLVSAPSASLLDAASALVRAPLAVRTASSLQWAASFQPYPPHTILLGMAEDGLPVLLDLRDPSTGPLLVVTEEEAHGTAFLQAVARSLRLTHRPGGIEYFALTSRPWQWTPQAEFCGGILTPGTADCEALLQAFSTWMAGPHPVRDILVLFDARGYAARPGLSELFSQGPAHGIWPIVCLEADAPGPTAFYTKIFRNGPSVPALNFRLREDAAWVNFSILE